MIIIEKNEIFFSFHFFPFSKRAINSVEKNVILIIFRENYYFRLFFMFDI